MSRKKKRRRSSWTESEKLGVIHVISPRARASEQVGFVRLFVSYLLVLWCCPLYGTRALEHFVQEALASDARIAYAVDQGLVEAASTQASILSKCLPVRFSTGMAPGKTAAAAPHPLAPTGRLFPVLDGPCPEAVVPDPRLEV